jgi:hypothetical protein
MTRPSTCSCCPREISGNTIDRRSSAALGPSTDLFLLFCQTQDAFAPQDSIYRRRLLLFYTLSGGQRRWHEQICPCCTIFGPDGLSPSLSGLASTTALRRWQLVCRKAALFQLVSGLLKPRVSLALFLCLYTATPQPCMTSIYSRIVYHPSTQCYLPADLVMSALDQKRRSTWRTSAI